MLLRFNVPCFSSNIRPRIICGGLLLLLTLFLLAGTLVAQTAPDAAALEPGKPIERELAGGQAHSYRLALTSGQFLHVVVDQRGIDVVVALFGPDGKKLAEVDSPNGTQGPEPIFWITEVAGDYRLEVRSLEAGAAAGRYEAKIEELRAATAQDRPRVAAELAAEQAFAEGVRLQLEVGTEEAKRQAIEKYKESLLQRRITGDRAKEAITLNFIANNYNDLGEQQKALELYNQALTVFQAVGDRYGEAVALNNIGHIYDYAGEKQKALDAFNQALPLYRAVGEHDGEATVLNNIGKAYDDLGEKQKALEYYGQALPIMRAVGYRFGEVTTLNNIGKVYQSLGENQKALEFYNQALQINREIKNQDGEAYNLLNIGVVYVRTGENEKGLDFLNRALALVRSTGDRSLQIRVLSNIGTNYGDLNEQQKALEYFSQALSISRSLGERPEEANTLYLIARAERNRNSLVEARKQIEAALAIIESLRTKISSQELRTSYFATVQGYYKFYIDLLMQLQKQEPSGGYEAKALQASERGRARSLLETLAEANADIRQGVDPTLLEREQALQQRLNAKAEEQTKLLGRPHTEEQGRVIAQEIETLTTEFQQVEAQIRQTSPRYAALTQPQPLTLKEIQTQVLDSDTLLLEYSLGTDRSYLWAVTPNSITSYELPKRDEIEAVARQVYALLSDQAAADDALAALRSGKTTSEKPKPRTSPPATQSPKEQMRTPSSPDAAAQLSQMLLAPVAAQMGNKRLLIVADGALQYIPFSALPSPASGGTLAAEQSKTKKYRPLVIIHEIVSLPSASTLAVLRQEVKGRKPAAKTVAVLADPVFESDDERVVGQATKRVAAASPDKSTGPKRRELPPGMERVGRDLGLKGSELKIPRLPGTRDEAGQILALVPSAEGKQALDFSASRQTATSAELSQYRYVHFATHGFLDSLHPELSGIVFSMIDEKGNPQDGFLRAHEVFNLKLPAELVVLSACQTGLGKEVKGEGLVGLTRGFMYAGAPRVVVSLWSVNDQATAELMARFYRGMLRDKLRPAAALRAAQVSLMKEKSWQSPFYWAAFTLQGEWR